MLSQASTRQPCPSRQARGHGHGHLGYSGEHLGPERRSSAVTGRAERVDRQHADDPLGDAHRGVEHQVAAPSVAHQVGGVPSHAVEHSGDVGHGLGGREFAVLH